MRLLFGRQQRFQSQVFLPSRLFTASLPLFSACRFAMNRNIHKVFLISQGGTPQASAASNTIAHKGIEGRDCGIYTLLYMLSLSTLGQHLLLMR